MPGEIRGGVNPDEKEMKSQGSFEKLVEKGEIKEGDYVKFNGELRFIDKIAGRWFSLGELDPSDKIDPKKAVENTHPTEELNEAYEKGFLVILNGNEKNIVDRILWLLASKKAIKIELDEKKLTEKEADNRNLLILKLDREIEDEKNKLGIKSEM